TFARLHKRTSRLRSSSAMRWTAFSARARNCTDGDRLTIARTWSYSRSNELLSMPRRPFCASARRSLPIAGPPFGQGMNVSRTGGDALSGPLPRRAGADGFGQLAPKRAVANGADADFPCLARAGGIAAQERMQDGITDLQLANVLMQLIVFDA